MLVRVLAGLIQQNDLVDMGRGIFAKAIADRLRRTDQTAGDGARMRFRILGLPTLILGPQIDGSGRRPVALRADSAGAIELLHLTAAAPFHSRTDAGSTLTLT